MSLSESNCPACKTVHVMCITVFLEKNCIVKSRLFKVNETDTFLVILERALSQVAPTEFDEDSVHVQLSNPRATASQPPVTLNIHDDVEMAKEFDPSLNSVTFHLNHTVPSGTPTTSVSAGEMNEDGHSERTITDVLMQKRNEKKGACMIEKVENKKDELHNCMIKNLGQFMLFPSQYSLEEILKTQSILSNTLWYLDGRKKIILDRQTKEQVKLTARFPERCDID